LSYLSETPVLQAIATEDNQQLSRAIAERVDAAVAQAEASPEVAAAAAAYAGAVDAVARLEQAERVLTARGRELGERLSAGFEEALGEIVARAGEGRASSGSFDGYVRVETEHRLVMRAIERTVEHLLPRARIDRLRAESHMLDARGRALEAIGEERAAKLLESLRGAVEEEVVVPVDTSKGVCGALMARAADLRRAAVAASKNADRLQELYSRLHKEKGAR
jgi:hypothetical protein